MECKFIISWSNHCSSWPRFSQHSGILKAEGCSGNAWVPYRACRLLGLMIPTWPQGLCGLRCLLVSQPTGTAGISQYSSRTLGSPCCTQKPSSFSTDRASLIKKKKERSQSLTDDKAKSCAPLPLQHEGKHSAISRDSYKHWFNECRWVPRLWKRFRK